MDTVLPSSAENKSLILFPPIDDTYRFYVYTLAYPDGRVFYVGKGTKNRINTHELEARGTRKNRNSYKVNVIRKIWRSGEQVVKTKLAFFHEEADAHLYEMALIFFLPNLTNLTDGGEGTSGYRYSDEARAKMRLRPITDAMRQAVSRAHKGRVQSESERRKKSEAGKRLYDEGKSRLPSYRGRTHTEQTRARMSARRKGRKLSPEARAKISAVRRGQKRTHIESEETKQKRNETRRQNGWLHNPEETRKTWREQRLGKASFTHTPESLEKKRIASTGKHLTEETKQKIREARISLDMRVVEGVKEIRLSYWRLQRDLTQRELARICHVAADTISEVENGKKIPRMGVLQKLAIGLDITFDQLVICEEIRASEGPIQQLRGLWNDI